MNRLFRNTLALGAFALLGLNSAVNAQTPGATYIYFPVDTVISAIAPDYDAAVVGYDNNADYLAKKNGTSPTVTYTGHFGFLDCYNHSVVNMSTGYVNTALESYDYSIVNMSGGYIQQAALVAHNYSTINMSGGASPQTAAAGNSTVNVTGGSPGEHLIAQDSGTVNVSGGRCGYVLAQDSGVVNVSGGVISGADSIYSKTFTATKSGIINFYGTGLGATLIVGSDVGGYRSYTLYGTLVDGSVINGKTLKNYLKRVHAANWLYFRPAKKRF